MLQLPSRTCIVEVAPRDGLQSLDKWIDTATKVKMVDRLSDAGFPIIEVTSFSHPKNVPHLRDAEEVFARISRRKGTIYRALVPNAHGAERAVRANVDEMLGLITISNTYLKKNQNMTRDQVIAQALECFSIADRASIRFVVALASSMWCPYEGQIAKEDVIEVVSRLHDAGVHRMYLAGSLGMEDPRQVSELFRCLLDRFAELELGFHAHNLSGFGAANVLAAVASGAQWIEGAACGIGGGIALPSHLGSVGNLATEDIIAMLSSAGIDTGVSVEEATNAARDVAQILDIQPRSHAALVGTRAELHARTCRSSGSAGVE